RARRGSGRGHRDLGSRRELCRQPNSPASPTSRHAVRGARALRSRSGDVCWRSPRVPRFITREHFAIMTTSRSDFTDLPNLAGERFGTAVIAANDEFFAPKEGLIKAGPPEWREGLYTERGKWMDGWEKRRRRSPGYDWAIIRLGLAGIAHGVVIDTSFYTGNYPERASIDACDVEGVPSPELLTGSDVEWWPLLAPVDLVGNAPQELAVAAGTSDTTHARR